MLKGPSNTPSGIYTREIAQVWWKEACQKRKTRFYMRDTGGPCVWLALRPAYREEYRAAALS